MKKGLAIGVIVLMFTIIIALITLAIIGVQNITYSYLLTPTQSTSTLTSPTPTTSTDNSQVNCENANHYLKSGQLELAQEAYSAVLSLTPGAKCALEGLSSVRIAEKAQANPPTPTPLSTPVPGSVVSGLVSIGDNNAAYSKFITGIETGDTSIKLSPFWKNVWIVWNIVKNSFIQFILPLLSGIVVLMLLIYILIKFCEAEKSVQMKVDEFKFGSISFSNEGIGAAISNQVKDNLYNYYSFTKIVQFGVTDLHASKKPFTLTNRSIEFTALPSTIPNQISSILDFIMKLFPPKTLTISGQLEYQSKKGVGLSITFDDNNPENPAKTITFWEDDLEITPLVLNLEDDSSHGSNSLALNVAQADQYYIHCLSLANVASAWVYYRILKNNKESLVKEFFGTDDFNSIQWFILFLHKYYDYKLAIKKYDKGNGNLPSEDSEIASLIHDAKKLLLLSLKKDQHNSIASFNLGWLLNNPTINPPTDLQQNSFTLFLTQAIQTSDPTDSININANYCLGNLYLNHFLERLENESIDKLLESNIISDADRKICFEKYFKSASEGAANSQGMKENLRLAFKVPYLLYECLSSNQTDYQKYQQIKNLEVRKNNIEIHKINEYNVDFYYNLACFYSLIASSTKFSPILVNKLRNQFYKNIVVENKDDQTHILLCGFAINNLDLAYKCDYQKVLRIQEHDKWLDYVKKNKKEDYEQLINNYKHLNDFINPKNE